MKAGACHTAETRDRGQAAHLLGTSGGHSRQGSAPSRVDRGTQNNQGPSGDSREGVLGDCDGEKGRSLWVHWEDRLTCALVGQDPRESPCWRSRQLLPFPEEDPTKAAGTGDIVVTCVTLAGARATPS